MQKNYYFQARTTHFAVTLNNSAKERPVWGNTCDRVSIAPSEKHPIHVHILLALVDVTRSSLSPLGCY